MKTVILVLLLTILVLAQWSHQGPIAYGVCQTGCAGLVMACYSAAGVVFGTVTAGVGTPVAIVACNTAFGTCSAKCALIGLLAPTP
jgi:hypothetical protein